MSTLYADLKPTPVGRSFRASARTQGAPVRRRHTPLAAISEATVAQATHRIKNTGGGKPKMKTFNACL